MAVVTTTTSSMLAPLAITQEILGITNVAQEATAPALMGGADVIPLRLPEAIPAVVNISSMRTRADADQLARDQFATVVIKLLADANGTTNGAPSPPIVFGNILNQDIGTLALYTWSLGDFSKMNMSLLLCAMLYNEWRNLSSIPEYASSNLGVNLIFDYRKDDDIQVVNYLIKLLDFTLNGNQDKGKMVKRRGEQDKNIQHASMVANLATYCKLAYDSRIKSIELMRLGIASKKNYTQKIINNKAVLAT